MNCGMYLFGCLSTRVRSVPGSLSIKEKLIETSFPPFELSLELLRLSISRSAQNQPYEYVGAVSAFL